MPICCTHPKKTGWLIALLAAMLLGCGAHRGTPEEQVARAKDYQIKGDLRAAIIELKNALEQAPNNMDARWLLGNIYVEYGNGAAAEKEIQRALELGVTHDAGLVPLARAKLLQSKYKDVLDIGSPPSSLPKSQQAQLLALEAHASLSMGQFDSAQQLYDLALSIDPESTEAMVGKANTALSKGDTSGAEQWLAKIFTLAPDAPQAWSLKGDINMRAGKLDGAEQAYGKALEKRGYSSYDLLRRSLARIALKKYDAAAQDIKKLKALKPGNPEPAYAQGLLDFEQKHYDKAQSDFQNAVKSDANYLPAQFYLGITNFLRGQNAEAEQSLQTYHNKVPSDIRARQFLSILALRRGDYQRAKRLVEPVLAHNPQDVVTRNILANAALGEGDTNTAVEHMREVAASQPQSASARTQLGLSLLMQGERGAGVAELNTAIDLDPKMQQAGLMLALAHLRDKNFDKALEVTQRLNKEQPDQPVVLNLLGVIQRAKGNEGEAVAAWTRVIEKVPGDPAASNNLADLAVRDKKLDKARPLYEQVLKQHQDHMITLLKLATLDALQGKRNEAEKRLLHTIETHPEAVAPRILLGRLYLQAGQPDRTLDVVGQITGQGGKAPGVLELLSEAQLALGQTENATANLEQLARKQNSAEIYYMLAKAYQRSGNPQKAAKPLDEALRINPNFLPAKLGKIEQMLIENKVPAAAASLGEIRKNNADDPAVLALAGAIAMRQQRPQDAVIAYRTAQTKSPNGDLAVNLALAQWQSGDRNGSTSTLQQWADKHPDDIAASQTLAGLYIVGGRERDALTIFKRIIKQKPNNVLALNNLAWLLRKSNPRQALEYSEQALKIAPEAPPVLDTAAVILLDQGETERARRMLKTALEKAPRDMGIRFHFARALVASGDKTQARSVLKDLLAAKKPFPEAAEARALLSTLGS